MANYGPAYFYHPVVGGLSPAMVDLYAKQRAQPAPSQPLSNTHDGLVGQTLAQRMYERKPMTLSKTAICAVSGDIYPISEMIRFVIAPDGNIIADITGKLPGVFMWLKADKAVLQKAIWRNSFATHARQNVIIPDNLLEQTIAAINRQALQTLSLARRAGELIFGFSKVEEQIRGHKAYIYLIANDASDNGREKLERLAKHQDIAVIDQWSSAELSSAIGEDNTMHICLTQGGLAQNLLDLETKLKRMNG